MLFYICFETADGSLTNGKQAVLSDISRGKITGSGAVYNSFRKGRSAENFAGAKLTDFGLGFVVCPFLWLIISDLSSAGLGDMESGEAKQGILPLVFSDENVNVLQGSSKEDAFHADDDIHLWDGDYQRISIDGW